MAIYITISSVIRFMKMWAEEVDKLQSPMFTNCTTEVSLSKTLCLLCKLAIFSQGIKRALYSTLVCVCVLQVASKDMDMAPNAVDDTYSGCREEMLEKVLGQESILQQELRANSDFELEWNASASCDRRIPGLQREHMRALHTARNSYFFGQFNKAVESKGWNVTTYMDEFQFKSLHFLLMDTMQLLNHSSQCSIVYAAGLFTDITAVKGVEVRFGTFLRTVRDRSTAQMRCLVGTLFTITSCSVVDPKKHTCYSVSTMMVISPLEVFSVVEVKAIEEGGFCSREIVLKHSRFHNEHNCYLFPR